LKWGVDQPTSVIQSGEGKSRGERTGGNNQQSGISPKQGKKSHDACSQPPKRGARTWKTNYWGQTEHLTYSNSLHKIKSMGRTRGPEGGPETGEAQLSRNERPRGFFGVGNQGEGQDLLQEHRKYQIRRSRNTSRSKMAIPCDQNGGKEGRPGWRGLEKGEDGPTRGRTVSQKSSKTKKGKESFKIQLGGTQKKVELIHI